MRTRLVLFGKTRRLRALAVENARQRVIIANLQARCRRLVTDTDLALLCVPPERRDVARSLIRDRDALEDDPDSLLRECER